MFSAEEWEKVSQKYADKVRSIVIPEDATPAVILQLQAQLDELYTQSQLDFALLSGEVKKLRNMVKRLERMYYLDVKDQGSTEKERAALAQKCITDNHKYGEVDVLQALELIEEQYAFMKSLVEMVEEKTDRLITILGSLKLEQNISMVESMVPKGKSYIA